ncbi:Biotin-(Acetyl-CoA carboxylase) ligase [Alloalcanivorax dieselolei B5]|uniref:Bifunctional ligase/repressor BirA n=1 Tax=Alcanivorax dieselolei (strain DSM 16502 / CGMCC 1.3690 / MCCC 1A00001 / B-5) TaxID=930169 RepID=K0CEP5_ALCDB|nr:bifunctional biotin--[acetyl-CoA-carboxylase] ligase/biotin operon repressor BirA [Alloalcanivorax dieselolei]AFT72074.1 Biotin-(Acetyl-CoA carboxylase) ligase [Alloalcanivorax dieselolei B5]GGK10950.1 bifunctional ligase/repressor BirA [Alloalcanivorax dieselolei]
MEYSADLPLVQVLADGRFHSGADLGEVLGISRAAIWKRIQRLAELGLDVESVRGKGYRLARPLDLLDESRLSEGLAGRAELIFSPVTGSTNADALALAVEGREGPLVVTTEFQSAGRGRRGRQWRSPFAANIYLSVLYRLPGGFASLGGLSLAAGVAVSQVLEQACPGLPLGLKWPNDLLVEGRKLGGVLIELAGEIETQVQVVVGVGINVAMLDAQADSIDQPWTSLLQYGDLSMSRTELAESLSGALLNMLDTFVARGFAAFVPAYRELDLVRDKAVTVITAGKSQTGIARGVAEDGALCVEIEGKRHYLHGGEVSLRLQ